MSRLTDAVYAKSPHLMRELGIGVYAAWLQLLREGRPMRDRLAELEAIDRAPRERIDAWQVAEINRMLAWCRERVPYYRERLSEYGVPDRISSLTELAAFPVLEKGDVRAHMEQLHAEGLRLYPGRTSGTTGSPLQLVYDRKQRVWNRAAEKLVRLRAGLGPRDQVAVFWGRQVVPRHVSQPPFWVRNVPDREVWFSTFHLSRTNAPAYFGALRSLRPAAIETYPSVAYVLAVLARDTNEKFSIPKILTTSETLFPFQRETIQETFGAEVFDYYASAERVTFAVECGRHDGLHLLEGFGYTEPGETRSGFSAGIVSTGLTNGGMPLIRYRLSDATQVLADPCSCGLTSRRLAPIATKCEDLIVTPDGRYVSPSILTHPFKPLRGLVRSQIVQEALDVVVVRLEVAPDFDDAQEAGLLAAFRDRLGDGVRITVRREESIEPEPSGKFRWVISRVRGAHQVGQIGAP